MILHVKKLHSHAKAPSYAHPSDAGMDLFSCEHIMLQPHEQKLVPTGISMAIPNGHVGLIWDKSGIASKGIKTMGGVIDANYRGEIKVIVHNLSQDPYLIEQGHKIAQMLIQEVKQKEIVEVDNLDLTDRGVDGFGSTGL